MRSSGISSQRCSKTLPGTFAHFTAPRRGLPVSSKTSAALTAAAPEAGFTSVTKQHFGGAKHL